MKNQLNKYDQCEVWWYYNLHYSETGCVAKNLNDIYARLKYDGYNHRLIQSEIKKHGAYEDFQVRITKIKFYGDLNAEKVYILRAPYGIYSN